MWVALGYLAIVCLELTGWVNGQHTLTVTKLGVTGNDVQLNLTVTLNTQSVTALGIWDQPTNLYPCRTNTAGVDIEFAPGPAVVPEKFLTVTLTPAGFQTANGLSDCPFNFTGTEYTFIVRTFTSSNPDRRSASDREFIVTVTLDPPTGEEVLLGSTTFTLPDVPTLTPVTADDISVALEIIDDDNNTQTSLRLGQSGRVQVVVSNSNYNSGTSVLGALVHSCEFADNAAFTDSQFLVGDDGCMNNDTIFTTAIADTGFTAYVSDVVGMDSTFKTASTSFTMVFTTDPTRPLGADINLYFRCNIEFCFDNDGCKFQMDACTPGTPVRRRRSADIEQTNYVHGKLTITDHRILEDIVTINQQLPHQPQQPGYEKSEDCHRCTDTVLYKGLVGSLGTVAVIGFGVMFMSFSSTSKVLKNHNHKKLLQSVH